MKKSSSKQLENLSNELFEDIQIKFATYINNIKKFKKSLKKTTISIKNVEKNQDNDRKEGLKVIVDKKKRNNQKIYPLLLDNLNIVICSIIIFIILVVIYNIFTEKLKVIDEIFIPSLFNLIIIVSIIFFINNIKNFFIYILKLGNANRYDKIFTYLFLVYFFIWFNTIDIILSINEILILLGVILIYIIVVFFIYKEKIHIDANDTKPLLISDKPLPVEGDDNEDSLGFKDKAYDFSEILYNNGSTDNQVFGLVAEWGAGKTSFLNKLQNTNNIKEKCLYIEFNPWYFENEKELLESFLDNIIFHLKGKKYYLPRLSKTFKNFIRLIEKNSSSLFGLDLSFSSNETLKDLKDNITLSLQEIDKKIIIVIDDLDRVSSNKLKEIFRIVDLCRDFYNTNYILCYDPLNFNSIDIDLIETIGKNKLYLPENKRFEEIISVDTQTISNMELTNYMSKIINVYYPILIDKEKLKQYFIDLFTKSNYISFTENSIKSIIFGIDNLFSIDNFRLWGKYYSNIRGMKRILNNLITVTNNESNLNVFHEIHGVKFDVFIKISTLLLYHSDLFSDIYNEGSIDEIDKKYDKNYRYKLRLSLEDVRENTNYIEFLDTLSLHKYKLLTDVIPIIINKIGNNKEKYEIRFGNNINNYIHILLNDKKETKEYIDYNVFITSKVLEYKNSTKTLDVIFEEVKKEYELKGLDKFIRDFIEQISNWEAKYNFKKNKSVEFINFMIIYDDFYKFKEGFDFTFYIDIAKILDSSVSYENTPENFAYIGEYFYGEGNYKIEKPLYVKILDKGETQGEEGKLLGLRESLRLLFTMDQSRGGNFNNFWAGMGKPEKLFNGIFSEFKKRYINKINIFGNIYEWESSIGKKGYSLIGHITYMLTHYSDEKSKKELSNYFIECFGENLEYFLKFLESFVKDEISSRSGEEDYYIDINEFLNHFIKEDINKFIKKNEIKLAKIANKNLSIQSKYQGRQDIEINQKELFMKFSDVFKKITKN